ncbi:MAG: hypothetical protein WAM04_19080 [Candidatus Sulfotelmatobacter sp.]
MTTLFGNEDNKDWIPVVQNVVQNNAPPAKKRSLTPLLIVVFLASYGLMTMLIVEQGATIQSQRNLIQILLGDSTELWALKGKALHEKQMAQIQRQAQPLTQTPSTHGQTPSTQTPSSQNPSTQAVPQHHSPSRAGKSAKPQTQAPQTQVPPMPASDLGDQRRDLIKI